MFKAERPAFLKKLSRKSTLLKPKLLIKLHSTKVLAKTQRNMKILIFFIRMEAFKGPF